MMPKLVYLDSNDFSDLSHSEAELTDDNKRTLDALREAKHRGNVEFYYSAIHISEAIHAAIKYKPAAVARAKLIQELCGTNLLRYPTDLFRLELDKAFATQGEAKLSCRELFSQEGEWFGFTIDAIDVKKSRREIKDELQKAIAHYPRRDRKRITSQLDFSKAGSRTAWKELYEYAGSTPTSEFPFNLLSRDISFGWLMGDVSEQEIRNRLVAIVSDPFVLFTQLIDRTKERETLYRLLRKEGEEWTEKMKVRMQAILPQLAYFLSLNMIEDVTKKIEEALSSDDIYKSVIQTYSSNSHEMEDAGEASQIVSRCPALSLFINVFKFYFRSLVEANIARLKTGRSAASAGKPSDFGDFMHLIYAPYFDIFRCDARFGALLKQNQSIRDRILDRRTQLIGML